MVSIGVSGHRKLINFNAITFAIDEVLSKILVVYGKDLLEVISPLAEGADRMVARHVINNFSGKLIVPLPLEKSDYMLDFESSSSKAEFNSLIEKAVQVVELSPKDTRLDSYLAAGIFILDHCDVLIALWDGEPSKGIGGTAEIVAEARRRDMPIAWVQVARKMQESPFDTNNISEGVNVIYERFPIQLEEEAGGL